MEMTSLGSGTAAARLGSGLVRLTDPLMDDDAEGEGKGGGVQGQAWRVLRLRHSEASSVLQLAFQHSSSHFS